MGHVHFASCFAVVFYSLLASLQLSTASRVCGLAATTYANSTSSTSSSTQSTSSSFCQPPCIVGHAGNAIEFDWVIVSFDTQVLVTVLVQINTVLDVTTTTTKYGTATYQDGSSATGYVSDITSFWNSVMRTTGVVVVNDIPTLTLQATVYTPVGHYVVIATALANYFSAKLTTSTLPGILTVVESCTEGPTTEFALTPTATPLGFSDPYQAPVGVGEWIDMIPASLSKCAIYPPPLPASAIGAVSALTTTSTQYDNYVHPQSSPSSTAKQSTAARNSGAAATTTPNAQPPATSLAVQTPQLTSPTSAPASTSHVSTVGWNNNPLSAVSKSSVTGNDASTDAPPSSSSSVVSSSTSTVGKTAGSPAPVVVSGTTISPGSPAVTIGGTKYSLAPSSPILVVGSSTSTLTSATTHPPVVVAGTTITPGAPTVTIGGTKYSLAPSSPILVVGSLTSTFTSATTILPVVVAGTTITPSAPAVTLGGTTYSLAASSSVLAVDGSTLTPHATFVATSSGGVGSLIWSGIGGMEDSTAVPSASATGSGPQIITFTGAANRVAGLMDWRYWLAASLIAVLVDW